jgi:hypothetical protein
MHWAGNEELRAWFKGNMEALGFDVVEGGRASRKPVSHEVLRLVESSDLLVAVLTHGSRTFVDQELGVAMGRNIPVLVFCDTKEGSLEDLLRGMERTSVIACPFDRDHLADCTAEMIDLFNRTMRERELELYERNVGFTIKESSTEVRFFDWGEENHSEIYEKWLKVLPLRDGSLTVNIKSGSSAWRSREKDAIRGTHRFEVEDLSDGFHFMTHATIDNAVKGRTEELFETSERLKVPNASRDCIHPDLAGYSKDRYWCIVFHVLYTTEVLRFKARLPVEREVVPESIKVLHHAYGTKVVDEGADISLIGGGEGSLQYLRWERQYPEPGSDYVIIWKWAD